MKLVVGNPQPGSKPVSIFTVVVLYKMRAEESATLKSLQAAVEATRREELRLAIFVADNTPGGQEPGELPAGARYERFPENPGLARPYNLALARAEAAGFDWLLTLDQDTRLPANYLAEFAGYARRWADESSIAAIVPRIEDDGVAISPLRFVGGFMPRVAGPNDDGILGGHASALNSASLLRVAALRRVAGYDERFPLNNSDTAMFHRLDLAGYRTLLAGAVVVRHELAIMRRERRMTLERYERLLEDERDFWDLHMGMLGRTERLLRLCGRVVKGFANGEEAEFRRLTMAEIWRRVSSRRATRIEAMRQEPAAEAVRQEREPAARTRSENQDRERGART